MDFGVPTGEFLLVFRKVVNSIFLSVNMLTLLLHRKFVESIPVFRKLLTISILPYLPLLCFNLRNIVLCVCDILEF